MPQSPFEVRAATPVEQGRLGHGGSYQVGDAHDFEAAVCIREANPTSYIVRREPGQVFVDGAWFESSTGEPVAPSEG